MDAKQLAALIRERRRSLLRGEIVQAAPKPEQSPKKPVVSRMYPLGAALYEDRRKWVQMVDARPTRTAPKLKRTAKPSPLTRIAQQLPAKLPRVPLSQ